MNYTELKTYFTTPRADYWETIIQNGHTIVAQLNISNQSIMAKDLGLTQPQISIVIRMLKAHINLSHSQEA